MTDQTTRYPATSAARASLVDDQRTTCQGIRPVLSNLATIHVYASPLPSANGPYLPMARSLPCLALSARLRQAGFDFTLERLRSRDPRLAEARAGMIGSLFHFVRSGNSVIIQCSGVCRSVLRAIGRLQREGASVQLTYVDALEYRDVAPHLALELSLWLSRARRNIARLRSGADTFQLRLTPSHSLRHAQFYGRHNRLVFTSHQLQSLDPCLPDWAVALCSPQNTTPAVRTAIPFAPAFSA